VGTISISSTSTTPITMGLLSSLTLAPIPLDSLAGTSSNYNPKRACRSFSSSSSKIAMRAAMVVDGVLECGARKIRDEDHIRSPS
jgi:hypothetical protein